MIGVAVKTDKQVFTANVWASITFVQLFIVQNVIKTPTNVRFTYTMFERRLAELDGNIHIFNILLTVIGDQLP
jgi:hypothetical protein